MILNHYIILVNLEIVKFDNVIAVYLKIVDWYFKVHILSNFWSIIKLFSWNVSFNLQNKIWKQNMKPFSNKTLNFFLRKFCNSYILDFAKTVWALQILPQKSTSNFAIKELCAMGTGEPCTCEYVTLLQSFHRGTLSIHWYVAQNFWPTFSMTILFRRSFKTAIFSRFLKVAIAKSSFINKVYNSRFAPDCSVSMLKETIALVWDYVSETRK